jgi:hypothetical protein
MDATLVRYLKLTPEVAVKQLRKMRAFNEENNLPFILLWHNETQSNSHGWKGWNHVLNDVFSASTPLN